jgi:hypothetical protein
LECYDVYNPLLLEVDSVLSRESLIVWQSNPLMIQEELMLYRFATRQ